MPKIVKLLFGVQYCRPCWEIGGLPMGQKWSNLKFLTISNTNSKLNGGQLNEKMSIIIIWSPILRADLKKGVCQLSQNGPIWTLSIHLLYTIQIERGSVKWKWIPTLVFWAPYCGPFGGGSAHWPRIVQFYIFRTIPNTKSEFKGASFYKKIANSYIMGHLDKWRSANRPRMDQFENFQLFLSQNLNWKGGPFYKKNCLFMYLGPHNAGCLR